MQNISGNSIKVNRALRKSGIGIHPASASAMLDAIPPEVIEALPSRLIAQLLDANWAMCQASKVIADADAIKEGAVWDASRQCFRGIAA